MAPPCSGWRTPQCQPGAAWWSRPVQWWTAAWTSAGSALWRRWGLRPVAHTAAVKTGLVATALLTAGMALPLPALWPLWRFLAGMASALVFVYVAGWVLARLALAGAPALAGLIFVGPGMGIAVSGLAATAMVAAGLQAATGWAVFAALAAGLIWGAAIGAAWNGGHYVTHYGGYGGYGGGGIHINNGDINIGSGNRPGGGAGAGNRPGAGGGGTAWKPSAQPRATTGRVGDPARGGMGPSASTGAIGSAAGSRGGASAGQYGPSAGGSRGGAYGPPSSAGAGYGSAGASRAGASGASAGQYGSRSSYGGGYSKGAGASSFGGYGSGHSTSMASSRGSMSRGFSGGGRRR